MSERAHIYEGDHTTTGGTVIDGIDGTGYNGRRMAYLGAAVRCPACGTTGRIERNGARFEQEFYGKVPALENDYCACACNPKPLLRASRSGWVVEA
ncbi:PAAR domain-containing protein [Paraburkholderia sp. EG287B]|uniref:PAAR domain-containing protein n=1 Tax=Paraburkholderia sp. EG287B TaxID=3237010 RepID=UPI0034D387AC